MWQKGLCKYDDMGDLEMEHLTGLSVIIGSLIRWNREAEMSVKKQFKDAVQVGVSRARI
jgi:hypothetical protein